VELQVVPGKTRTQISSFEPLVYGLRLHIDMVRHEAQKSVLPSSVKRLSKVEAADESLYSQHSMKLELVKHLDKVRDTGSKVEGVVSSHKYPSDARTVMLRGLLSTIIQQHRNMLLIVKSGGIAWFVLASSTRHFEQYALRFMDKFTRKGRTNPSD
jgi:hypothetical protein